MAKKNLAYTIPRNGLVWEWLLDGNANDTNDWTKNNGTATWVTYSNTDIWYQKQWWVFSGSSTRVAVNSNMGFSTGWNFSYCYWFKTATVNKYLLDLFTTSWWNSRLLTYVNASWNIDLYFGTWTTSGISWTDNKWHFISVVQSWSTASLYIDGKFTVSETRVAIWSALNGFTIWSPYDSQTTANMVWNMQWVRMYTRSLDIKEIQNLYQEWLRKLWAGGDKIMDSVVAYYDFNGDANDIVGGNNGTVTGATLTTDRFWISNRAYDFWTTWSSNNIRTTSTLWIDWWNITMSAWVKKGTNITSGKYSFACYQKNWSSKIEYRLWIDNASWTEKIWFTRGKIWIADNNAQYTTTQDTTTFHHWVGTYNWTNVKFYLDWVLQATTASSWNWNTALYSDWFSIWNNNDGSSFIHTALTVSDCEVMNRALSDDEVKELYNISSKRYLYPFKKTLPKNLKDWLVFWGSGDTSGTTYYDASGWGNNCTTTWTPPVNRVQQHKSISLNGSGQYVVWTNKVVNISGSNNATIAAWFKYTSTDAEDTLLGICCNTSGAEIDIRSGVAAANIEWLFYSWSTTYRTGDSGAVNDGKWHLVIIEKEGTNVRWYLDRSQWAFGTIAVGSTSGSVTSNGIWIWRHPNAVVNLYSGNMWESFVWNRILSKEEKQALFYSTYIQ